jgi:hypothetical protein
MSGKLDISGPATAFVRATPISYNQIQTDGEDLVGVAALQGVLRHEKRRA